MQDINFLIGKMPVNFDKVKEYGLAVATEDNFVLIILNYHHLFHSSIKLNIKIFLSDSNEIDFGGDLVHFFASEVGFTDYAVIQLSGAIYGELYKNAIKTDEGDDINYLLKQLGVVISDKEDEFSQLNLKEYKAGIRFYIEGADNFANRYINVIAGDIERQKLKFEYFYFSEDNDEWYIGDNLRSIAEFTFGRNSDGFIEFWIEQPDSLVPEVGQGNAFNYFMDNQEKVLDALSIAVFEYCKEQFNKHATDDFKSIFGIDGLETVDDVKKIISINAINILEEEKDNFSYLGFGCGCSWDEEHGLRVTMHKDKVVSVDDDSNYAAYYEILKDKMTEEEWATYNENQAKAKEENLSNYYEEREALLASGDKERSIEYDHDEITNIGLNFSEVKKGHKKWWKFW